MKQRILSIMAAICLMGLSGCGKSPEVTAPPTLQSQAETTASQAETVPEASTEAAPEAESISAESYCGTWKISKVTAQDVTLPLEDWIKLGMDSGIADFILVLQDSGKAYLDGKIFEWQLVNNGIKFEDTTCALSDGEIVMELQEITAYWQKASDDQTFPEQEDATAETAANGIRPEFKEAMDAYEAFYDEYCELLEKYKANPTDFTILTKYMDMMAKIEDVDKAFNAWNSSDLSAEELKYYLDVSTRIQKKLVDLL